MVALCLATLCASARAYQAGISGYSGRRGETCADNCHSGGAVPEVVLRGPASVAPGAEASFDLYFDTPRAGQFAGGLDIAAAGGELLPAHDVLRIEAGELTHIAPRAATDVNRDGRRSASDLSAWVILPRNPSPAPCQRGDLNGDLEVDGFDAWWAEGSPFAPAALGWSFVWQAPSTPGVYILYAAGLSANCNGTRSGDAVKAVTREIRVE